MDYKANMPHPYTPTLNNNNCQICGFMGSGLHDIWDKLHPKGVEPVELPPPTPDEISLRTTNGLSGMTVHVPEDFMPLIPDLAEHLAKQEAGQLGPQSADEVRKAIEEASLEAQQIAQTSAKVDLEFPAIGFINPVEELEKMRRLAANMAEHERKLYPDQIRSKLLAHHSKPNDNPAVTDEELALAIYIKRTTDSALSPEEIETKSTGKRVTKPKEPKPPKEPKAAKKGLDDLLSGLSP
jgi:hypothetical protein